MKNILVPTDLSDCSINALNYAGALSKYMQTRIYFLHVYQPLIPAENILMGDVYPNEEMEKEFTDEMNQIITKQKEKHRWTAPCNTLTTIGITSFEINNIVSENKIDLIIMGMHNKTKPLTRFFGNHATDMIKKANCPILFIPENTTFHSPDRIALAFDFKHPEDLKKISVTKQLAKEFNSKLLAFSVIKDKEYDTTEKNVVYDTVDKIIMKYEHSIHFDVHSEVPAGILSFIENYKAKMLVMFHHTHNIFERIFSTINSKEISFNIKIPLLIINEKANIYPPVDL